MSDTAAPAPMPPLPCSELERIIDIVRGAVDKPLPKPGEFSLLWNTIAAWKTRPAPTPCKMRVIAGHECIEGTCTMRSASDGEYDCGNTRPAPAPLAEPSDDDVDRMFGGGEYTPKPQAEQPDVDALIDVLENALSCYQHAPNAELKSAQAEYRTAREALRAAFAAKNKLLNEIAEESNRRFERAEKAEAERDAAVAALEAWRNRKPSMEQPK